MADARCLPPGSDGLRRSRVVVVAAVSALSPTVRCGVSADRVDENLAADAR